MSSYLLDSVTPETQQIVETTAKTTIDQLPSSSSSLKLPIANRLFGYWVPTPNHKFYSVNYRFGKRRFYAYVQINSSIFPCRSIKDFTRRPSMHVSGKKIGNILSIRRKRMNKHKWKKLRRSVRDSTRYNKSKRKKNRERLMNDAKELGIEFEKNNNIVYFFKENFKNSFFSYLGNKGWLTLHLYQ